MQSQTHVPKYFQELAPQWARLGLWNKKLSAVFERLRHSTLQKISASDDGFLILYLYKPSTTRDPVLVSIQKSGSGLAISNARPVTQSKPNSIVQLARKYLQGRRIAQVLLSLEPVAVIIEFAPANAELAQQNDWPDDAPDCLVIDLDARPARVCVSSKTSGVPGRYASQCTGYTETDVFFESHCEWSLENTKTKRRATFTRPLVTSCILKDADHREETHPDESHETPIPSEAPSSVHTLQRYEPASPTHVPATPRSIEVKSDQNVTLQTALNQLPTHVRRMARTRLQFLERRLLRQRADLPSQQVLEQLKRKAETLRANIYLWPKNFPQWHVPPDLIEHGLPAIITLKAGQSPGSVVTEAFSEIDKLSRRRSELERRVEESRLALERFQDAIIRAGTDILALPEEQRANALALAREVKHLVTVEQLLTQLELTWTPAGKHAAVLEAEKERRLPYRSFRSSSGEFIRVSKSAADADAMLKLMPAHHLWVHVISGEGSHVWLEKPKGQKPTDQALLEASMLAIHHSKQTRAQEADVYVALRGDLDKRKDLPPGKVIVRRSEHRFVRYAQDDLHAFLEKQNT